MGRTGIVTMVIVSAALSWSSTEAKVIERSSVAHPGQCPFDDLRPFNDVLPGILGTSCARGGDECNGDGDCSDDKKCCGYGCTTICLTPCSPACPADEVCRLTPPPVCNGTTCGSPGERAVCQNPCADVTCPHGALCKISSLDGRGFCFTPPVVKPGVCPPDTIFASCSGRNAGFSSCHSDSDCGGERKCCARGCGRACVAVCDAACRAGRQCVLEYSSRACASGGCHRAVCRPDTRRH